MLKRTVLGLAAAAAVGLATLSGGAGEAQAGVKVHIGVPFPGVYVGPPAYGPVYYGGYWGPSFYYGPTLHPRFYYHPKAPYHCHGKHGYKKCHRHW